MFNSSRYSKYKSMAEQELEHASIIHEFLVEDILYMKQKEY